MKRVYPPIAECIVIPVETKAMEECMVLARQVAPDYICTGTTVDERVDDLVNLCDLIRTRHGYVAVVSDKNSLSANGAGITRIVPVPSDALRNHCAALKAGPIDGTVEKEVIHGS